MYRRRFLRNCIWILQKDFVEGFIYQSSIEISNYLRDRNVDVEIYDYRAFKFGLSDGVEALYYRNELVTTLPKVVFARGNCYKLMQYLNRHGVKIINGFMNMVHMKDKWQTYLDLKAQNILQPDTFNSNQVLEYEDIVDKIGTPFIIKYRFGAQGKSVYLINSKDEYLDVVSNYYFDDLIIQEYISSSYGRDIRIFVVGDKYFGVIRDNSDNDFRANLAQGGISYKFDIPDTLLSIIKTIQDTIEAEIVGLDFLIDGENYTFCEANGNAGYKAFLAHDIDMSRYISEYIFEGYFKE